MHLIDWIQFVAKQDDHHLASAPETPRSSQTQLVDSLRAPGTN